MDHRTSITYMCCVLNDGILDENTLIDLNPADTHGGLAQDLGDGRISHGIKLMSSYEKKLRILTELLGWEVCSNEMCGE